MIRTLISLAAAAVTILAGQGLAAAHAEDSHQLVEVAPMAPMRSPDVGEMGRLFWTFDLQMGADGIDQSSLRRFCYRAAVSSALAIARVDGLAGRQLRFMCWQPYATPRVNARGVPKQGA